ncbi:MAG: hypothetical protein E7641_04930 [Ruminococcaceae bacterium]|nr:hypothetical protein [Oscillospiraceae bacterium]
MNNTDYIFGTSPKRFQMPLCQKTVSTELSNDFNIPEYLGEIRKILRISATVSPAAKYVGGTVAEFNGNIEYSLLYVGTDGELYSASLPTEYAFEAPLEITGDFDMSEGVTLFVTTDDESITTRVTAPRKLNVKSRLTSRVDGYGIFVAEERSSGEVSEDSVVRLNERCKITDAISALCDTFTQTLEIDLPYPSTRVVSAYAYPRVSELIRGDEQVTLKGETELKLLVSDEGGRVEQLSRALPFDERIEIEGITSDSLAKAMCHVGNLSVTVGDEKISSEIEIIPELTAYSERELDYVRDVYSTENNSECAYRAIDIPVVSSLSESNFSQSERVSLGDTVIPIGSRVVTSSCKPITEKIESEKGKLCIYGQCRYSLITEKDGEYTAAELQLPFKYEIQADSSEDTVNEATVSVSSSKARIDSGNIAIDTELSVSLKQSETAHTELLSEVRYGEPSQRKSGDMIICFPSPEDTAWSVSKRYQVPLCTVSGISSPTAPLENTSYIVINS